MSQTISCSFERHEGKLQFIGFLKLVTLDKVTANDCRVDVIRLSGLTGLTQV